MRCVVMLQRRFRPSDIRYSQDSIRSHFSNDEPIVDLFRQLLEEEIHVDDVPEIEVVRFDAKWWALTGNRRLFCFKNFEECRVAGSVTIPVKIKDMYNDKATQSQFLQKFTTLSEGTSVVVRDNHLLETEFENIRVCKMKRDHEFTSLHEFAVSNCESFDNQL